MLLAEFVLHSDLPKGWYYFFSFPHILYLTYLHAPVALHVIQTVNTETLNRTETVQIPNVLGLNILLFEMRLTGSKGKSAMGGGTGEGEREGHVSVARITAFLEEEKRCWLPTVLSQWIGLKKGSK